MEGVVIDVKIFSRIDDQVVEKDRGERIGESPPRGRGEDPRQRSARRRADRLLDGPDGRASRSKRARSKRRSCGRHQAHDRSASDIKLSSIDLKTFRVENKATNEQHSSDHRRARTEEKRGSRRRRKNASTAFFSRTSSAGRHSAGEGLSGREAESLGRRQDGRTPRQQGYRCPHRSRGGHAVPARWPSGRHRAQPARRAEPNERRTDSRDAPWVGRARFSASTRRRRSSRAPEMRSGCSSAWCCEWGAEALGLRAPAPEWDVVEVRQLTDIPFRRRSARPSASAPHPCG